jgi:SAM-dependent methyltransferase
LLESPRLYDWVQSAAGCGRVFDRVSRHFLAEPDRCILEIGAGTGLLASRIPRGSRYIWLDPDRRKLDGFLQRRRGLAAAALLGDGARLPLRDHSVDDVLCVAVAHHLDSGSLPLMLAEAARVCRGRLIFLDPVIAGSRISRLLWRLDRGSFPRHASELRREVSTRFEIEWSEEFEVHHRYWLAVARPGGN